MFKRTDPLQHAGSAGGECKDPHRASDDAGAKQCIKQGDNPERSPINKAHHRTEGAEYDPKGESNDVGKKEVVIKNPRKISGTNLGDKHVLQQREGNGKHQIQNQGVNQIAQKTARPAPEKTQPLKRVKETCFLKLLQLLFGLFSRTLGHGGRRVHRGLSI